MTRIAPTCAQRLADIDWNGVARALDDAGHAVVGPLLDTAECGKVAASYADDRRFRKRVDMDRHAFGSGSYAYYAEPLPRTVAMLRERLYTGLAPIASDMSARLGRDERFPARLAAYRRRCAEAGQSKPTPLVLRYERDGYNRLHRDLYGELAFPLQVVCLLSRPGEDFTGGEFLLTEQRPRMQSRGEAIQVARGEGIVFPNSMRPVKSVRGMARAQLRHGMSRVLSGQRYTLGIIFHDAK